MLLLVFTGAHNAYAFDANFTNIVQSRYNIARNIQILLSHPKQAFEPVQLILPMVADVEVDRLGLGEQMKALANSGHTLLRSLDA